MVKSWQSKVKRKCRECECEFTINSSRDAYCGQCKPLRRKSRHFEDKYNMRIRDVVSLLNEQDYRCACCKTEIELQGTKGANVDHCHITGKVRGILCWNCNVGIGKLGDSIEGLMQALKYLQKAK